MSLLTYNGHKVTVNGHKIWISAPASYPTVLTDGNTVAWYDFNQLSTVTKDGGTGEVSRWNDYLGSGHDLLQSVATRYPIWSSDGITFDGSNDYMRAVDFTLNQPEFIYIVFKNVSWSGTHYIFDG